MIATLHDKIKPTRLRMHIPVNAQDNQCCLKRDNEDYTATGYQTLVQQTMTNAFVSGAAVIAVASMQSHTQALRYPAPIDTAHNSMRTAQAHDTSITQAQQAAAKVSA